MSRFLLRCITGGTALQGKSRYTCVKGCSFVLFMMPYILFCIVLCCARSFHTKCLKSMQCRRKSVMYIINASLVRNIFSFCAPYQPVRTIQSYCTWSDFVRTTWLSTRSFLCQRKVDFQRTVAVLRAILVYFTPRHCAFFREMVL